VEQDEPDPRFLLGPEFVRGLKSLEPVGLTYDLLLYPPQLPAAVPVRPDTCYFLLEAKGQMYERMIKAQSISIYVPAGMKELRLELLAVAA
jgi:predicted component of type VI protein secretion system